MEWKAHKKFIFFILVAMLVLYNKQTFTKLLDINTIDKRRTWHKPPNRIVAFGDSLTEGLYDWPKSKKFHPYTIHLNALLKQSGKNITVENAGVSGERVDDMKIRLEDGIIKDQHQKTVFIILAGTNDYIHMIKKHQNILYKNETSLNVAAVEIAEHIEELHTNSHRYNVKTLAVSIPPISIERKPNTAFYRNYRVLINNHLRLYVQEQRNHSVFVDLSERLEHLHHQNGMNIWDDGVHFNPRGYDEIAVIVYEALMVVLNQKNWL